MLKNKGYTLINVIGLSLGIVSSLVIFSIIRFETGFDSHHDDVERIYRVVTVENRSGDVDYKAGIPYSMPEALTTDFPEIEYLTLVDRNFDRGLARSTLLLATGRARAGAGGALDLGRARLPGRGAGALVAEDDRARRVRGRHRCGGARGLPAAVPQRRDHPRARAVTCAGVSRAAGP